MTEDQAKRHLLDMLTAYTPGTVLHQLTQVIREAEMARLGSLDEVGEERVRDAESALWVFGHGIDATLPR